MPDRSKPITSTQAAELFGVELRTLHNWVNAKLIPHFRTPGRHLRFHEKDVERFMAKLKQEAPEVVIPDAHAHVIAMARAVNFSRSGSTTSRARNHLRSALVALDEMLAKD